MSSPNPDASASTPTGPDQTNSSLIFLHCYYDLPGIGSDESLRYFQFPKDAHLKSEILSEIEHLLPLFRNSYEFEDAFSCAEYPDVNDLDEEDLPIFRAALRKDDRECDVCDLHPSSQLVGIFALMRHKLALGTLANFREAADLFNSVMESALNNSKAYCQVDISDPTEFAAPFLRMFSADKDCQRYSEIAAVVQRYVEAPQCPPTISHWAASSSWSMSIERYLTADGTEGPRGTNRLFHANTPSAPRS